MARFSAIVVLALAAGTVTPATAQRTKLPMKLEQLEARAQTDSNDAAAHYNVALGYWNEKAQPLREADRHG